MQEQLLNSNNLKEKLKELGQFKEVSPNVQAWLDSVAHKHWLKRLPQETFNAVIDEPWFKEKISTTIFKQLIITPQFTSEVNHLIDFLRSNIDTNKNLNKLNYLECQRQTDAWVTNVNKKVSLEEDWDGLEPIESISYEGEQYILYELKSRQNLLREGKIMNNCISTYADDSEEKNKNTKFYSLRDKSNKSLVSLSANVSKIPLEPAKVRAWEKTKEKKGQQALAYFKLPLEERKKIEEQHAVERSLLATNHYWISEIKEKNNDFLEEHRNLTKKMLNKLLANSTQYSVSQYVLEEAQLIESQKGTIILLELSDLSHENYDTIVKIPDQIRGILNEKILNDANLPLSLMIKTDCISLSKKHSDISTPIHIAKSYQAINIKELKDISLCFKNDSDKYAMKQVLTIQSSDNFQLKVSKNVSLKAKIRNSHNVSIQMGDSNSLVLVDSQVKEVLSNSSNASSKVLLIDTPIESTGLYNEKNEPPHYNILSMDTKNGTLKLFNTKKTESSFCLLDYMHDDKSLYSLRASAKTIEDFLLKKICFKNIMIDKSIKHIQIDDAQPYHIKVSIPIKDKKTINLLLEDITTFKKEIINSLLTSDSANLFKNGLSCSIYQQDFDTYRNSKASPELNLIINDMRQDILKINEKYKDNPNAISYAEPLKLLRNKFIIPGDTALLSPKELEVTQAIRDIFIECAYTNRVNKSRTKLSKSFATNLSNYLEYIFNHGSTEAKQEMLEIFLSPKNELLNKQKLSM